MSIMIIFDCDMTPDGRPIAFHTVDIERRADNQMQHPTIAAGKIDKVDFLAWMNANPAGRKAGGWDEPTKLPGHPDGTTRWDILCATAARSDAPAELKALNLLPAAKP